MPIFCKNLNISQKFFTSIGLSRQLEEIRHPRQRM